MRVFSTTELGDSLQRCETSWHWGSLNGAALERPLPSKALALGSLIHYTMADWGALYAGLTQPEWQKERKAEIPVTGPGALAWAHGEVDPIAIFGAHYQQFKKSSWERYEAWRGAPIDPEREWQEYEDEVGELGEAMIANYYRFYGSPFPPDCTLLSPELTIVRPLPKIRSNQRQLYIEGTLDQFLLDSEGMLFPRDFKTYNDAPSRYELETWDQALTYCGIVREEFPDYQIGGFAYDGLWKRKEITSRMRRKDGSPRDETDLFQQEYLMYSDEAIENQWQRVAFRAEKAHRLLLRRQRYGPQALDVSRGWATCPSCSFNDICKSLTDGDFGEWDEEAEAEALAEYIRREKSPAWRTPLRVLAAAA